MTELYNRTRSSKSIPLKLLKQGRVLAVPIYYLVQVSDLGREGAQNSGSYRFADHIYRNQPSGKGALGKWIDKRFLSMPAVRSFRYRYEASRDALFAFLQQRVPEGKPLHILTAPCGIPRELADGARKFVESGGSLDQVTFHGLDLDPKVLEDAGAFAAQNGLQPFLQHQGNALDRASYPCSFDFITCTGLAEFIDDEKLTRLYGIFHDVLNPGGMLVTSGMRRVLVSEYFLRLAELKTTYRNPNQLESIARKSAFSKVRTHQDDLRIQTILTAIK